MGYNPNSPELGNIELSERAESLLKARYVAAGGRKYYIKHPYDDGLTRILNPQDDIIHGLHTMDDFVHWRMAEDDPIDGTDMRYAVRYAVHKGLKRWKASEKTRKDADGNDETAIGFYSARPSWRKGFRGKVLARAFAEDRFQDADGRLLCSVKVSQEDIRGHGAAYIYPEDAFRDSHARESWEALKARMLAVHVQPTVGVPVWADIKHLLPENAQDAGSAEDEEEQIFGTKLHFDHHGSAANRYYYDLPYDTDWASLRDYFKAEAEIFGQGVVIGYVLRQLCADPDRFSSYIEPFDISRDALILLGDLFKQTAMETAVYRNFWMHETHPLYGMPDRARNSGVEALAERVRPWEAAIAAPVMIETITHIAEALFGYRQDELLALQQAPREYDAYASHLLGQEYAYGAWDVLLNGVHAGLSWQAEATRIHPDRIVRGQEGESRDPIPLTQMTFYDLARVIDYKFRKRTTDISHLYSFVSLADAAANMEDGRKHTALREERPKDDVERSTWRYTGPPSLRMQREREAFGWKRDQPIVNPLDEWCRSASVRKELEQMAVQEAGRTQRQLDAHGRMLAWETIYEGSHRVATTVK